MAALVLLVAAFCPKAAAQFKEEAFTQSYVDTSAVQSDSTDTMISFKEFFGGITHRRDARIGTLFAGSMILPGGMQLYNRDYWKLPVIYGGLGATIGLGIANMDKDKDLSQAMFWGAGAIYWGALLDGAGRYRKGDYPQPGKATIYSILLPGLGQAYNGEYWKIPVYWSLLIGAAHYYDFNVTNYRRFRDIYNEATGEGPSETATRISSETALYYRNYYRRWRDYSVLFMAGFYLLQVIDANVFAYMHDFNTDDDLSLRIAPTAIPIGDAYALAPSNVGYGLSIGLRF